MDVYFARAVQSGGKKGLKQIIKLTIGRILSYIKITVGNNSYLCPLQVRNPDTLRNRHLQRPYTDPQSLPRRTPGICIAARSCYKHIFTMKTVWNQKYEAPAARVVYMEPVVCFAQSLPNSNEDPDGWDD